MKQIYHPVDCEPEFTKREPRQLSLEFRGLFRPIGVVWRTTWLADDEHFRPMTELSTG